MNVTITIDVRQLLIIKLIRFYLIFVDSNSDCFWLINGSKFIVT